MARTISDEELQLRRRARRRLIGAIVLVTAIVVVLPMVLDSEPKPPSQGISVEIPSPGSGLFAPKVVPPVAAPAAKPAPTLPQGKPAAMPSDEAGKVAAVAAAPARIAPSQEASKSVEKSAIAEPVKPVTAASAKEPAAPAARTAKPAARSLGKFVVQVIALADAERAKQIQGQIAAAGIRSYTEVVKTSKGDVTRVRAGPFASRAAAEKAREQLKALNLNGNITTR
ncbi:MAG: SPOR domain-containing protein [Betaproteobacteria bacterium]|nr:SPOR domain-containing protein [Betaproteobacteria bacterium]